MEIDECKFGRRKYNRGRAVEGHWVFGGMERGGGDSFLVEVAQRDAATLLPIIAQYVRPGTVVYSDKWSAYNRLVTTTGNIHLTTSLHFANICWLVLINDYEHCRLGVNWKTAIPNMYHSYLQLSPAMHNSYK